MTELQRDRPAEDVIEISLFGPGYGESVVIHLGYDRWLIVDSCLDKLTKRAAALVYLEEMGVNPETQVELIVCTHWHDDHIRGMAATLAACPHARFFCSSSLRKSAFLELVALGETIRGPHGGGVSEFSRIMQQMLLRRQRQQSAALETCQANKVLLERISDQTSLKIEALSPSDRDHQRMSAAFAEKKERLLSSEYRQTVPSIHPNLGSIVLRILVGQQVILLGADMENRKSPDAGWNAILCTASSSDVADFYKIAHHGSETGDAPEIWSKLLVPHCPAALTPNHRLATPLPKAADVERILTNTPNAHATAPSTLKRSRLVQPADRLLRDRGIEIYEIPSSQGQIRARSSIHAKEAYAIQTFGRALLLTATQ
jgi:beta-lactamase superfamily II metal-dependent hydrolase